MDISKQLTEKIKHYCAYAERSVWDVRRKLAEWKVGAQDTDTLIGQLRQEGYIDEERFASAFVRGKFHLKGWGVQKIVYHLQQRHIPAQYIESALAQIDSCQQDEKLELLAKKWLQTHHEADVHKRRQKLIRYLVGKGYAAEHVMQRLQTV